MMMNGGFISSIFSNIIMFEATSASTLPANFVKMMMMPHKATTTTTYRYQRTVISLLLLGTLLMSSLPSTMATTPPYNLMGIPPKKLPTTHDENDIGAFNDDESITGSGGKKIISTATNSPIYYINKLDLPSLFINLLPLQQNKKMKRPSLGGGGGEEDGGGGHHHRPPSTVAPNPLLEALIASVLANKKNTTTTTSSKLTGAKTTTVQPPSTPIKRIPIPFISNARPVGSYQLKPLGSTTSLDGTTTFIFSSELPSTIPPQPPSVTPVTTTTTTSSTTTSASATTPQTPPSQVQQPYWMNKYSPSKIIRLKTKFVANGQPSAVYVFKSPERRYSMQDLLRRQSSYKNSFHHRLHHNSQKRKKPIMAI